MNDDLQSRIEEAVKNPRNLGEMKDADAIGCLIKEQTGKEKTADLTLPEMDKLIEEVSR